jgi:Helitron helicase-like domain at N-terminus
MQLIALTPEQVDNVAKQIESETSSIDSSSDHNHVFQLLKHVKLISACIPGSDAAKLLSRNSIRSFFAMFGMPHIFLTLNLCAAHSPIFQLMYGDNTVDLGVHYPILVSASERAIRLAHDPVAASDFFEFSIHTIFQHLYGWDYKSHDTSISGGVLGHLQAWSGTSELTECANLHGHFLIWLLGGLNPDEVHKNLSKHDDFEQ